MTINAHLPSSAVPTAAVPRTQGTALLSAKQRAGRSVLGDLRVSGALKFLFPRGPGLEAVMLNTSGGLTGGDRLSVTAHAGADCHLTLTTQAAERVYRSLNDAARVTTRLSADPGADLHWLPQETILFEGGHLDRSLRIDLAPGARCLMVEPLIFGRHAMGEVLRNAHLSDDILITRDGAPIYADRMRFSGDLAAQLAHPAIGAGGGAAASLVYAAPDAEARLPAIRRLLPGTGGASLLAPDLMVLRLLAGDGFALRQTLLPVLGLLRQAALPKVWRL